MTFVGKILVIIILVFSLFFLALSTVVYKTSVNWKDKSEANQKLINDAKTKNAELKAEADNTAKQLKAAQDDLAARQKDFEARINSKQKDFDAVQKEITENRTLLETAQKNSQEALLVAKARTQESDELKTIVASTQKQANDFKLQQSELKDRIRILERELTVAKETNTALRERNVKLGNVIRDKGIDLASAVNSTAPPPQVEGEVTKVDAGNRKVEISIGSDDGLAVGHVLYLFSTNPPSYKGKIVIDAVDPDQAAGTVQGKTERGQKIKEGDHVSSEIRSRS